jgi:hypothetical protein
MMVIMVLVKSMIRSILNYIKYSNLIIIFNLNPFAWGFEFNWVTKNDMDPGLIVDAQLELGPVKIVLWIDDGRW